MNENINILNKMLHSQVSSLDVYQTTPYWKFYEDRFIHYLQKNSLINFRNGNYKKGGEVLHSFGASDILQDNTPNLLFRFLRAGLRIIGIRNKHWMLNNKYFLKGDEKEILKQYFENVYNLASKEDLNLLNYSTNLIGNPHSYIKIDNNIYTEKFLKDFIRFIEIKKLYAPTKNQTIVELGSGSGKLIEILFQHYDEYTKFILVDLPTQLYTAYTYLSNVFPDKCFSYEDNEKNINLDKPGIYFLTNNQIEKLSDESINLFISIENLDEMEEDTVKHYLNKIKNNAENIFLIQKDGGLKKSVLRKLLNNPSINTSIPYSIYLTILKDYSLLLNSDALNPDLSKFKNYKNLFFKLN
jgi:putative sugar O-methyltransferase